jgi:uncharacterized protein
LRNIIQQRLADAISMDLPKLTKRNCHIPDMPGKVYSVIGMRRSGKTYFLFQVMESYLADGVDRSRLVYFNFEDERFADISVNDLHWITDEYYVMFPENRSKKVYFLFDEVQLVKHWERYVRRLLDSENVRIFVSGSSAKMLSREIASSLRGRSIEIPIYPYSFKEFASHHQIDIPINLKLIGSRMRSILENLMIKYLNEGGFPEAQGLSLRDRHMLLQGYVNSVLFRDVIERFGITNIMVLKTLIRHLIKNTGSKFTVNKFYNELKSQGIKVAKTTLHEYLDHLQDAFLLHLIPIYADSERKRMVNPVKSYVIDTGLAVSFMTSRDLNLGHLLENSVFMELRRRDARLTYLRTESGYEIDFLAHYAEGARQAIQVAADVSDPLTRDRECRSLVEISALVPDADLLLINLSEEAMIKINHVNIQLIPAWKWLLDKV